MLIISIFTLNSIADHRVLHSFPTRRSSDLFSRVTVGQYGPCSVRSHHSPRSRFWSSSLKRYCHTVLRTYRSEEHTSELQSQSNLVCRLLLAKKKKRLRICLLVQAPGKFCPL